MAVPEPLMWRVHIRNGGRSSTRRYRAHAFWLTFIVIGSLLALSFWSSQSSSGPSSSSRHSNHARDLHALVSEEEECRLIHGAKDQCAFVYERCPDAEPGYLAYLDLYYCTLAHMKPVAFIILLSWLGLLFSTIGIAASDFFCIDLSTIATILGMSESMAGVTFLAFGNGSPDVFSTFAAMSTNSSSLAIGELIGAAGFITAVVAGSMALVRPFRVPRKSFIRDVGFFVVAAAFSMGFLADGKLHLWECVTMVVFYVFYVCVVVLWHWWLGRRLKQRQRELAARGHFIAPGTEEELAMAEEYHDEEEDVEGSSRPSLHRGASERSFSALENTSIPRIEEPGQGDEEEDEEARDRWMSELSGNMRLSRTGPRSRRNTITPVRPSLVGALEFQAVLSSLSRSRNHQTIQLSRRFSDDPNFANAQYQDMSSTSDPSTMPPRDTSPDNGGEASRPSLEVRTASGNRARAVSANDAHGLKIDPNFSQKHQAQPPSLLDIAEDETDGTNDSADVQRSPDRLAPPMTTFPGSHNQSLSVPSQRYKQSPDQSPRSRPQIPKSRKSLLNSRSPQQHGQSSPFPPYRDDPSPTNSRPPSLYLPPPSVSQSTPHSIDEEDDLAPQKPISWWPYRFVPPPMVITTALFPTLCGWRDKGWWEKFLGVVAAPSVFLLTVTLPVVEADKEDEDDVQDLLPEAPDLWENEQGRGAAEIALESPLIREEGVDKGSRDASPQGKTTAGGGLGAAAVATDVERHHHHNMPASSQPSGQCTPHPHRQPAAPKLWNRWLTITQLFLAPILIVLVIHTQYITPDDDVSFSRFILKPILISLLVSILLLIPLLLTTTPTHRPRPYLTILSLAGFIVSIGWISTIAGQVVALLKTFAVILNMSHAILGLTVFAVGNSLADLIADITVAKLGYPVMALSACFGGPMLNILLGIGLSGCWILVRGAEHRHAKHPDRPVKYKTYEIQVGDTLIVSGVFLLITLVGLLIAVPMNKWMMTRRIAFCLIALWVCGTIVNVVLEVVGLGEDSAAG